MNKSEFKKKLSFFGQSLRSSFRDNTASVALLFFSIFVMTIFSAFFNKLLTTSIYEDTYPSFISAHEIPPSQQEHILENFSEYKDLVLNAAEEYELSSNLNYEIPAKKSTDSPTSKTCFVHFVAGNNDHFTSEEIANGKNLIVMSDALADDYNAVENSVINFYGTDYRVTKIFIERGQRKLCYLPITHPPREYLSGSSDFKFIAIGFNFVPEEFYFGGEQEFIDFGLSMPQRSFTLKSLSAVAILFGICLLSGINILAVYAYFAKVNGHKYSIYKTLGAKNGNLAAMMLAEVMIIAIAAFGIGLLFDFVVSTVFDATRIKLPAIHYSILIGINLITVLLTTVFSVVKRARLMPVDRRIW